MTLARSADLTDVLGGITCRVTGQIAALCSSAGIVA
jgi:hypothetical protein